MYLLCIAIYFIKSGPTLVPLFFPKYHLYLELAPLYMILPPPLLYPHLRLHLDTTSCYCYSLLVTWLLANSCNPYITLPCGLKIVLSESNHLPLVSHDVRQQTY